MHLTVRHGRYNSEVFVSAPMEDEVRFQEIIKALQAKGFTLEVGRWPLLNTVSVSVVKLKSDKAIAFASDVIVRAGKKANFSFFSTQHH